MAAEPLVSARWLNSQRGDANLVVLDIRSAIDGGGAEAYSTAHMPGAMHSDDDKAGWRVMRNNVPFMVPTVPELEKLIGELGMMKTAALWSSPPACTTLISAPPRAPIGL
jgi:thiosulfate/3-mercaptopyruvate sulfurtransferase